MQFCVFAFTRALQCERAVTGGTYRGLGRSVETVWPYGLVRGLKPSSLLGISGVPRGGVWGGFKPSPKFRSFDKAEPNSLFRGKYIRNCLVFLFHHPN
jgi:hypothetical protein